MGKSKCCNQKCGLISAVVVGAILVIIGGISVTVFDIIFNDIVIQEGQIEEGNTMYETWSVVTTPTYMSYYFYNVTNAEEFLSQKSGNYVPPVLEELGPYTFREYLKKDNIAFLENTDPEQVYFTQTSTLVFDPTHSIGTLDDQITTINIIAASLASILQYQFAKNNTEPPRVLYATLNRLYKKASTELLFKHTAHDILFGFNDPLYTEVVELFATFNITIPATFGLFATANTSAGWFDYTVYTGKQNHPELINTITSYKNETELTFWSEPQCNKLNGTDGTTTPPFMTRDRIAYFFVDDVCRSLYSIYDSDVTIKRVPSWKYIVPPEIFQSPLTNPENECFCNRPDDIICQVDGGLLIESCMGGAPILISSPHFLYGDGYYFNQSKGISPPNREEHESALVFEPNSGITIKADKRLQVNVLLRYNENIDILKIIQDNITFPVVWLNESATVGQDDADLLYGLLVIPKEVVSILQIILCVVGGVLFVGPLFYLMVVSYGKKNKTDDIETTVTRFSSSENEVFKQENGKTPVYENVKNVERSSKSASALNEVKF